MNKKMVGDGDGNGRRKGLEVLVKAGDKKWNTVKMVLGAVFASSLGFVLGRRSR